MSEWINATDRLPDKDGRYLVVEKHMCNWVGVSTMRNGKFDIEITNWMPLPKPPEVNIDPMQYDPQPGWRS